MFWKKCCTTQSLFVLKNRSHFIFHFSLILSLFICSPAQALRFVLPQKSDQLVGALQSTSVKEGEDFSDIALRYGIGYYEIVEANPGVDPDEPKEGAQLIIPTQYILPNDLEPNTIYVNLTEMRLYYEPREENAVYIFPVGIGKVDWDTPLGRMHVSEKISNPRWVVPESIWKLRAARGDILPKVMPAGPENPLGSFALRLSMGNFLIHGTNLPSGVGRRSSAGCIRLYEKDIKTLFGLVKKDAPVLIVSVPYKAGWLNGKLYLEAHTPLFEQRIEAVAGDMSQVIEVIDKAKRKRNVSVDWQKSFKIANQHLGVPRMTN